MAVKNMEKWLGFQFSSGSYVGDDYKISTGCKDLPKKDVH